MNAVSREWGTKLKEEIDNILIRHPYNDGN
jgi:hypothetical protein